MIPIYFLALSFPASCILTFVIPVASLFVIPQRSGAICFYLCSILARPRCMVDNQLLYQTLGGFHSGPPSWQATGSIRGRGLFDMVQHQCGACCRLLFEAKAELLAKGVLYGDPLDRRCSFVGLR
jgi:hypothetical protein